MCYGAEGTVEVRWEGKLTEDSVSYMKDGGETPLVSVAMYKKHVPSSHIFSYFSIKFKLTKIVI